MGSNALGDNPSYSLAGIRLLGGLDDDTRGDVEKSCRWKHYKSGEQIIDRQSDSRDIFFIVYGRVRVVNYSLSGREVTLDDYREGGHFGELSALDGQPRSASVMSLVDSLIASLPHNRFLELLERHPTMALNVMRQLARIVRSSTDRIMDLSTLGANNRVHAELLRQARANMDGENTAVISPIPVHGDIASRVSTTRETVARVMNDLARRGFVERGKDAMTVLDVQKLEDMVEEVRGE